MNFFKKNKKIINLVFLAFTIYIANFYFAPNVSAETCSCVDGAGKTQSNIEQLSGKTCQETCVTSGFKGESTEMAGKNNQTSKESDSNLFAAALEKIVKTLLMAILVFVGWLVLIAVVLLKWILDPNTFSLFFNNEAIRDIWVMTRDFLNIGFILVLLFSAFCTIFQIDKYHIKSVIFKLILMALLVNFSFPIARFVIDISNVTMYWLLNNIFEGLNSGAGLFASISGKSGLPALLIPQGVDAASIQHMLAAISFSFIFGITLLIIAFMFVIRLIVLGIVVMFSPVGFAAAAFPVASKYASRWWDALFKYSFFAPIMIFMLAVALKIIEAAGSSEKALMDAAGTQTDSNDLAIFISKAAIFSIPVIVLWIGMGMAQTLSIAGASAVTEKGKQIAQWAGRQPWRGTKGLVNSTGIPGGVKQRWSNWGKKGKLFGSEAIQKRSDKWAGAIGGYKPGSGGFGFAGAKSGWDKARVEHERKSINETRKNWKDQGGADENDLHKALAGNDSIKAKAAALELAEKHKFKDVGEYKKAASSVKDDPILKRAFDDKVKEKHIKFVIENNIDEWTKKAEEKRGAPLSPVEKQRLEEKAYEHSLRGITADDLAKQKGLLSDKKFHDRYMRAKVVSGDKNDKAYVARLSTKMTPKDRTLWSGAFGYAGTGPF